ncbi:ATP-binding protein [Aliifodinibius sp. S!AR15-10]|uniref:sensor histidine kinase n=1 Tax=Aliifodinibius sp. S!AR15-10 TaxID=2950437 RepID=UPI0028663FE2|nr:ATP-binding protein [Aliifodinibius sp. S!AR15-10]MDR8394170.1 ATP-binding protein [Aliifodinibius sp. S!AR15-10]
MKQLLTSNRINIVLIGLLICLGIGSFAYNQYLVNRVLEQERLSVELWARAIEYTGRPFHNEISQNLLTVMNELQRYSAVPDSLLDLIEEAEADRASQNFVASELIIKDRFKIPSIIVDGQGEIIFHRNVDESSLNRDLIDRFKRMNPPIVVELGGESYSQTQYVYYGESPTVQMLRYFPYIQFTLLALLLGIAYVSYRTITRAEQSNLWVGMTKEAAHQLGTPLSSLYGWVELLRDEKEGDDFTERICNELEKDITRLRGVAERFNKIGSEPELTSNRIGPLLDQVIDYMEQRLPQLGKNVDVRRNFDRNLRAKVNTELFQWALENLLKNAMDAIKTSSNDAFVEVSTKRIENDLMIDIEDSGVGIEKSYHQEIFKPGFSTKQRGWGLGLSLTNRIIENYHKGKVFVLNSEEGKGTTIRIVLKLDLEEEEEAQ